MIKDGTFDKIFVQYQQPILDQAKVGERTILKIDNPFLPDTVPLERKELWFDPYQ